jgi:hypothetical protein
VATEKEKAAAEKAAAEKAQKIANDAIKKAGGEAVKGKKNTFKMDKAVEEEKKKRR